MATELEDKQGNTSINNPDPGQAYSDREFNGITGPDNYNKDAEDPSDSLSDQEDEAGSDETSTSGEGAASSKELSNAENLYSGNRSDKDSGDESEEDDGRFLSRKRIGNFFSNNKKKTIGGTVVGLLVGGGIFGSTLLSGPLQFIHIAQNMQKFHMSDHEDFTNDRTSKVLIYALLGNTAKGRLGTTSNIAADKWEKRLVSDTGMRPVYSANGTGRFVGFEIVNDDKAFSALGGANDKDSARLESIAGKGAEFKSASELAGDSRSVMGIDGKTRTGDIQILDLRNVSLKDRRLMTKVIGRQTGTNNIVSSVGSRLMVKRGGIDFHPLKNIVRNKTDSLADYRKRVKDASNQQITSGETRQFGVDAGSTDPDQDGVAETNPADAGAAEEANATIAEAEKADSQALKGLKTGLGAAKGPAVVVGVLCAVKGIGTGAEGYKYENSMKLMRYGGSFLTIGSQVMSGRGLNLDELGAHSEKLFNKDTNLGFESAASYQYENGQDPTGPEIPDESRPSTGNDKHDVFKAVDAIPALGGTCDFVEGVMGLPVIKQVSEAANAITVGAADQVLGRFGYSVKSLTAAALATISGKAIDLAATGADAGSLAMYGVRLMAGDMSFAFGGTALSNAEVGILKANRLPEPNQSVAQRYFDPLSSTSLAGRLIDRAPASAGEASTQLANSLPNITTSVSSSFANLLSYRSIAAGEYDYGFPQIGYSVELQNDERFEDPYKNEIALQTTLDAAKATEQQCSASAKSKGLKPYPGCEQGYSSLYELNTGDSDFSPDDGDGNSEPGSDDILKPYGRACFSSEISDSGALSTGESVNLAKLPKECGSSTTEVFLRYRIYIADTVTAKSLACYEAADEAACAELGFGAAPDLSSPTTPPAAPGSITGIGESSEDIPCAPNTKEIGVVTSNYNGEAKTATGPLRIKLCQLTSIPGRGQDATGKNNEGGAVVNSVVSANFQALGEQAAKENIGLKSTSSFRLADSCGGTGDGTLCATPGKSYHQLGVGIDFNHDILVAKGQNTTDCNVRGREPSKKQWVWLNNNAAKFGFKQYAFESWHWDAAKLPNRCSGDGTP